MTSSAAQAPGNTLDVGHGNKADVGTPAFMLSDCFLPYDRRRGITPQDPSRLQTEVTHRRLNTLSVQAQSRSNRDETTAAFDWLRRVGGNLIHKCLRRRNRFLIYSHLFPSPPPLSHSVLSQTKSHSLSAPPPPHLRLHSRLMRE